MSVSVSSLLSDLQQDAAQLGFDHLALTTPHIPELHYRHFRAWLEQGGASQMSYMVRDPEKRSRPEMAYPGVRSILTLAASYFRGNFPDRPGPGYGRIARYAWGEDYHEVIANRLAKFLPMIVDRLGNEANPRVAVDTKPLLERALSATSGLGFIGKNTVLIVPQRPGVQTGFHVGSYVFLAEILLDIEIEGGSPPVASAKGGCGGCTNCLTACPTGAFKGPYQLDSGRCIAYLTIENKGAIPRELRPHLGDWVFGCDVCQEVCPFNARVAESKWPEFHPSRGTGAWISLSEILSCASDTEFKSRWGKTPVVRAKRAGLIRNAAIVAANLHIDSLRPELEVLSEDSNPVIRGHALWALSRVSPASHWRSLFSSRLSQETEAWICRDLRAELDS